MTNDNERIVRALHRVAHGVTDFEDAEWLRGWMIGELTRSDLEAGGQFDTVKVLENIVFATRGAMNRVRSQDGDKHPNELLFDDIDYGGYYIVKI